MCLAVPGQILSTQERDGSRVGRVAFAGVAREAVLDFVPEAAVGDWVMVHVGFALSVVDEEEAARSYDLLREIEGHAAPPADPPNDAEPTGGGG